MIKHDKKKNEGDQLNLKKEKKNETPVEITGLAEVCQQKCTFLPRYDTSGFIVNSQYR
ncbi:hypothetical protein X777_02552 [Ooceraea biroi]|uniref:Uncharacterized protein n=1 Tax=Ooceraea biroi TaxID=2015173 RepID=A0A026WNP6_OOCBI|nr:hypothetical protein X777_02552 [Ooceraea biroi]